VTPNDLAASCADGAPDCDTGPNELQNFPVLAPTSTWAANGPVTLNGTLQSRPNGAYTIEFFANHTLNPAGFGEGEIYLGSINVATNASGIATFSFASLNGNPLGDGTTAAYFTATATNAGGSTSEFSASLRLSK
jgi:hypothetical protein